MPYAKSTDMIITEFESNGFYEPGFLHLNLNTDQSLENLNELIKTDKKLFSTFLHEYIHFLQEVTTTTGLTHAAFYINLIKDVNHTIINDGKPEFTVPFEFTNEYNALTQIALKKIYHGQNVEILYSKYDYYIEETENLSDKDGKILNVKKYKVFYYDSYRNHKSFYFGSLCLKEFIAHSIQSKFFSEIQHPDIPYLIAGLILEKECPALSEEFRIAICDACLMSYHPAQIFFSTIERLKKEVSMPISIEEIYKYTLDLQFSGNGLNITPEQLFYNAKEMVENHYENALQAEIFAPNLKWIKHILEEGNKLRIDDPAFIMKLLDDNGNPTDLFRDVFQKLGTPYLTNNLSDGKFIPPRSLAGQPLQPYQLLVFKQILQTFAGEKRCSLFNLCDKPESDVITNSHCLNSPWKRATEERLCPFAQMWKTWALTNEIPVPKN